MYTGMIHLHSIFRLVILLLLLVAVFRHFTGMSSRRMVNSADQKIDLFLLISAHLTLVVGIYLWIVGPWGLKLIQGLGFGAVMKNSTYRFFAVEHLAGMLIAIILFFFLHIYTMLLKRCLSCVSIHFNYLPVSLNPCYLFCIPYL